MYKRQGCESFGEAAGGKSCGSVDGEGNAEYLTAVIRELLRSTEFVDGLTGEGCSCGLTS